MNLVAVTSWRQPHITPLFPVAPREFALPCVAFPPKLACDEAIRSPYLQSIAPHLEDPTKGIVDLLVPLSCHALGIEKDGGGLRIAS